MKTSLIASTFALLSVSPLACSDDASIGDDQQAAQSASEDDSSGATDDDEAGDDAVVADDSAEDDVSMEDPTVDDAPSADDDPSEPSAPVDPAADDDLSHDPAATPPAVDPTATTQPTPIGSDPAAVEPSADPANPPESDPAVIDAGPPNPADPNPVQIDAGAGLVSEDIYGRAYDAEAGCFELRLSSAGTMLHEADNPPLCTAAFSLGVSPDGECWSFSTGCQPDDFVGVRSNPDAPGGVDHECSTGTSCPLDWECEPGVVPSELDRSCEADSDCYSQFYAGPCGCTSDVVGFNKLDVTALSAHLDSCVDPNICECMTPSNVTDSGEVVQYLSQSLVECVAGQCVTRRDPAYCAGATECVEEHGICVPTDASDCRADNGDCASCQ